MRQKFFISFNSADRTKAHWIAWSLKQAGHGVAVHDWEIPAGGNAPLWMNNRLAWADRLIAVISPDYVPARYSPMEWASQIWNDPDGTKGSVIPVIVRPTSKMPPLLKGLSRIDLTNCSEAEAKRRLIEGVDMPAPPQRKPAFEKVEGEAPDSQHAGPPEKPTFTQVNVQVPRSLKVSAAFAALALGVVAAFAVLAFFFGDHASETLVNQLRDLKRNQSPELTQEVDTLINNGDLDTARNVLVSGLNTARIMHRIRCESRDAVVQELQQFLALDKKDKFQREKLAIVESIGIVYDFTFNKVRTFNVSDNFEGLVHKMDARKCIGEPTGPNYQYPIVGTIGIKETIAAFTKSALHGMLQGEALDITANGPSQMVDTIYFTAATTGGVNPTIMLNRVTMAGPPSRIDINQVIVGLALPGPISSLGAPTARTNAEAAAQEAVKRIKRSQ
jgi:hypothetical protein